MSKRWWELVCSWHIKNKPINKMCLLQAWRTFIAASLSPVRMIKFAPFHLERQATKQPHTFCRLDNQHFWASLWCVSGIFPVIVELTSNPTFFSGHSDDQTSWLFFFTIKKRDRNVLLGCLLKKQILQFGMVKVCETSEIGVMFSEGWFTPKLIIWIRLQQCVHKNGNPEAAGNT